MRMSSVNAKHTEHEMRGAKPVNTTFGKDERAMEQIKRSWIKTTFLRREREFDYGRWKEKIQV